MFGNNVLKSEKKSSTSALFTIKFDLLLYTHKIPKNDEKNFKHNS